MTQPDWGARLTKVVAGEIRRYREERRMSAQELADRCKQAGMEIPRAVLANLENGRRATVTVAELLVLAEALEISPLLLVVPLARQELVEFLPGMQVPTFEAGRWWRGEGDWIADLGDGPELVRDPRRKTPVERVFEHQDLVARWIATHPEAERAAVIARQAEGADRNRWAQTAETHRNNLGNFEQRLTALRQEMRGEALIPPPLPPALAHIDPAVVAAIVTSSKGVLIGRRNDGKPPWTFIAGEQDAVKDELPRDTAVREVKEETGLRIQAGGVIGERTHPKTGRLMIYIAATPTHGTEVFVGDEAELAEVRWVSLAEADELMGGQMFGPVREYLARAESHDDHGT